MQGVLVIAEISDGFSRSRIAVAWAALREARHLHHGRVDRAVREGLDSQCCRKSGDGEIERDGMGDE